MEFPHPSVRQNSPTHIVPIYSVTPCFSLLHESMLVALIFPRP